MVDVEYPVWAQVSRVEVVERLAAAAPSDRANVGLRARIDRVVRVVPLPYPAFWLAALGEPIDWDLPLPPEDGPA